MCVIGIHRCSGNRNIMDNETQPVQSISKITFDTGNLVEAQL